VPQGKVALREVEFDLTGVVKNQVSHNKVVIPWFGLWQNPKHSSTTQEAADCLG
jgi:hypothetical protein